MAHIVTSALVIAKNEDGSDRYLYEGAVLGGGLRKGEVERLVEAGMVGKDDEPAPAADKPSSDKPAGNASLEAWSEYAKSQGATDDDLDGLSRDDLRDQYGK